MGLFVGANLDRVTSFHRKGPVRRDSVIEHRAGEHCRRRRGENRQQIVRAPPADPTGNQQRDCGNHATQPSATPASLLCQQASDAQARRYRLLGQSPKGRAQFLPLCGILRPPRPQLGMRRKIGFDGLIILWRQPAIDPRVQVILFYGAAHRPHFTLRSAAPWREVFSSSSPCIARRKRSRPRESLDITVPIGTPSTRAAS